MFYFNKQDWIKVSGFDTTHFVLLLETQLEWHWNRKNGNIVFLFIYFYFFYCSFVHSCRLTSDPVFRVEGTGGISATATSIFCHPGQRVLHLGRQERKTEEGHVEWEKKKKKNIRPGRGIIIFPLISSVWRSSHLRETQTEREYSLWYNLLPYEQRKTLSFCYLSLYRAGLVNPFWTKCPY